MFGMTLLRGTAIAVALAAAGFVGTSASAGGCGYDRDYNNRSHHDHVEVRRHGDHDHVTVRHHTTTRHGNHSHTRERVTRHTVQHRDNGYRSRDYHPPSGYYRQVWVPAVYRTYYDECGYPYRVRVRCGYYRRVWVSNSCDY